MNHPDFVIGCGLKYVCRSGDLIDLAETRTLADSVDAVNFSSHIKRMRLIQLMGTKAVCRFSGS